MFGSDESRMSDFSDEAKIRKRLIRPPRCRGEEEVQENPWAYMPGHSGWIANIPAQHAAKYPEHAARTRIPTYPPFPGHGFFKPEPEQGPVFFEFLRPSSEQQRLTAPQTTPQRLPSSHPSETTTQTKAKWMKLSEEELELPSEVKGFKMEIGVNETKLPSEVVKVMQEHGVVVVDAEGKRVPLTGLLHPTTSSSNPEEPGGSAKKD